MGGFYFNKTLNIFAISSGAKIINLDYSCKIETYVNDSSDFHSANILDRKPKITTLSFVKTAS
jgi:hypothetical protein